MPHQFPETQASIDTQRLHLRPFSQADLSALAQVANDFKIADTTIAVRYPFDLKAAQEWIAPLEDYYKIGARSTWAITQASNGTLMGMISLSLEEGPNGKIGELGFWLGSPYWGKGFASEAGQAIVFYAFDTLHLPRLMAYHFTRNPASGSVLKKLGFYIIEEKLKAIHKWEVDEDILIYECLPPSKINQ